MFLRMCRCRPSSLARGPAQAAAAEHVNVEVFDGLAAVRAGVDDEPVATFEVLGAGDLAGGGEQIAEQGGVFGQGVGVGGDVTFGNDEHVHGRLGVDVGEGDGMGILMQARDRDFPGDNFAEETVRLWVGGHAGDHSVWVRRAAVSGGVASGSSGGCDGMGRWKRRRVPRFLSAIFCLLANGGRLPTSKQGMSEMTPFLSVLERLKAGARRFQSEVHAEKAAAYLHAATHPQRPHTLVIACADSRVDVESITSSGPGEVFITRNIGNMVPAYGEMLGGVSAVIEYAVSALKVQHVVVCGHSDCGAMKALLNPSSTEGMPTVRTWLNNGQAALRVANSLSDPEAQPAEKLGRLTEENVLMQMLHLKTHPSVAGAMARGELTVSGWVYDIGSGGIRIAEDGSRRFVPVELEEVRAKGEGDA